jgi:uncharacterized protein YdhG (YjbR/CyaY superfamily)
MQVYGSIPIQESDNMPSDEFELIIELHNARMKELEAKNRKGF